MNFDKEEPQLVTHRLKPRKKSDIDCKFDSQTKRTGISENEFLSSISSKLNPRSISIQGESRISSITFQNSQFKVSCMDRLTIPSFSINTHPFSLQFEQLRRKAIRKKIKNLFSEPTCRSTTKKMCADNDCPIKNRWKNILVLNEKQQLNQTAKIRQNINSLPKKIAQQIQKDVFRSFPEDNSSKTKIVLYHVHSQKNNLVERLKTTLKMLALSDPEVSYVQGINLYAANIVSHVKDSDYSFIFMKQMMSYGNLRKMYINNFKQVKQQSNTFLHKHLKMHMPEIYDHFMEVNIEPEYFISFYLSLFANVVDYHCIPVIINSFMSEGPKFLDQVLLSMLCFFKNQLLVTQPQQIPLHLGATYIRSRRLPWQEIINISQGIQLSLL